MQHDQTWFSILVRTGVYQDGTKPAFVPKYTADNVLEAVRFAMEREHKKSVRDALSIGSDKLHGTIPEGSAILSPTIQLNNNPLDEIVAA